MNNKNFTSALTAKITSPFHKLQEVQPIELFYLLGGLFLTLHYYWILDDAFVYSRYIDNLLFLDIGLVNNYGEYVEGFSSPLWMILLTFFRLTGVNYWVIFKIIACISFIFFWFLLIRLNRIFTRETQILNIPLACLVFNYGVLCYFSSGMETPLVQVAAVVYALYIVNPESRASQVFLALSPLIRHELALPLILCLLWTWIYYKRFPLREVLLAFCFVCSYIIFRIYYYADLFPNTFYLKDTVDVKQGLLYLQDTVHTYHLYPLIGIFTLIIILGKYVKNVDFDIARRLMMVLVAVSVALYVIKIGGDGRHFRYLAFSYCLIVCSLSGISESFIHAFDLQKYRLELPLGLLISFIVFTFYPLQLDSHPFFLKGGHETINKINDAHIHRLEKRTIYSYWEHKVNVEILTKYKERYPEFQYSGIAAHRYCVDNYIWFDKKIIHSYGLTDAILARVDMKADRPAHKMGLIPLANDLIYLHSISENIGRGMYRRIIEERNSPEWIKKNLETIEIIERKIYNNHDFMENLKLAFSFPPRIKL